MRIKKKTGPIKARSNTSTKPRRTKPSKFNAVPTVVDGIKFASKGEANRYKQLRLLLKVGKIQDLELQVKFPIEVNGFKVCTYVCDFRYRLPEDGSVVVEDFKGVVTPLYRLKKKLVKALYGIDIFESTAKNT